MFYSTFDLVFKLILTFVYLKKEKTDSMTEHFMDFSIKATVRTLKHLNCRTETVYELRSQIICLNLLFYKTWILE